MTSRPPRARAGAALPTPRPSAALALVAAGALGLAAAAPAAGSDAGPDREAPDFARDVRPLLADKCFACHGPDAAAREADLRLDLRADATRDRGGHAALVPGVRAASELWRRVHDAADPMPPASSEKSLDEEERELLGRWIDAGAPYAEHWSFVAPSRPTPPTVADEDWVRNDVDRFVLARLEAEGLAPSPEADRATLLRRVTFDLTGLPPTPAELEAFLADERPDAYERVVERLFESPHHAEALTRRWLDAARYADTHGFHIDNERALHRWRDWVLDAFAANLPFDRFTREQLAGDLLPGPDGDGPTLDQRIATGFNRCNPTTGEGGLIAEEWLVRYAADRVETTATVFLGLTMQCAQCHDHKFDPVSQEDYYRFFAFFHNLAEEGTDRNELAPPPAIRAPYPRQREALAALEATVAAAEAELTADDPELDAAQVDWEASLVGALADRWTTLVPERLASDHGTVLSHAGSGVVEAGGPVPDVERYVVEGSTRSGLLTGLRLDALIGGAGAGGVGREAHGNVVLSEVRLSVAPLTTPSGPASGVIRAVAALSRVRLCSPQGAATTRVRCDTRRSRNAVAGAGGPGSCRNSVNHTTSPDAWQPVDLVAAEADHSQAGFEVPLALDGDPGTGWALAPRTGEPHTARFAAGAPFGSPGGTRVRVELSFASPFPRHALARFRLALGTDADVLASRLGPWERSRPFAAADFEGAWSTPRGPEPGAPPGDATDWSPLLDPPADGAAIHLVGANTATYLRRRIRSPSDRTLHVALGSDDAVAVWLDGERVHANRVLRPWAADQDRVALPLTAGEHTLLVKVVNAGGGYAFSLRRVSESADGLPLDVAAALGIPSAERDPAAAALVRGHFRRGHDPDYAAAEARLAERRDDLDALLAEVPLTMVAEERGERRPTYFLRRGNYQRKEHEVLPGTPAFLPPLVARAGPGAIPDRLDLAEWLLSPEHPLTARVTVNRLWQFAFGTGLVTTPEDFGAQGAFPTHPGLLDWLAVEFREGGWDVRALLRLVVRSSTYRQASTVTPTLLAADPRNLLLARGPRHRLDAEQLRDAALAASGLLVRTVGGPSVKPYQPDGLWRAVSYPSSNTANFRADEGDALHRRSLYTFWKRTSPPPAMALFDAPNREACTVRRSRTNTPLQALALMNETGFVEAARVLAERALREARSEGGALPDDGAVARRAFLLALARRPAPEEVAVLLEVLAGARADAAARPAEARGLLAVGSRPPQEDLDPLEVAAWTHVTNLLFNLDEFVTKR